MPSLGSNTDHCGNGTFNFFQRSRDGSLDCEGDENDGREPEADEPNLGSTSASMNKEGLGAGDGGDLGQGTTRAVLGSRKRFPNGSSAYFGRGPRIAYRTTKQPTGHVGGFSHQRRTRAFACLN